MKFAKVYNKKLKKWVWKINVTISGQRIRRAEFDSLREAKEAVATLLTKARSQRYGLSMPGSQVTLRQLIEARAADPIYQKQRGTVVTLNRFLKVVGNTSLTKLSKADLKRFVAGLDGEGLQARSINRYLGIVMSLLHDAGEYFPELEDWQPPRISRLKELPGRERVMMPAEIARLLAALKADRKRLERYRSADVKHEIYDLLRLMLLTGAREGELLKLDRSAVNQTWRTLRIEATKTKSIRVIPLSSLAMDILRTRHISRTRDSYFSITYAQLWRTLKIISDRAGVTIGQNVPGGWVFYDCRHTAASVMELNGIPYSTVSAILGHKRGDMTAHYTHSSIESMKQGVNVLESWCRDIDGFCLDFSEKQRTQEKQQSLAG